VENKKEETILLLKYERCEYCGKLKPDAKLVVNPYDVDVNNLIKEEIICDKCYKDISDDI